MDTRQVYENTYRIDPDEDLALTRPPIRKVLKEVMKIQFEKWSYNTDEAAQKCEDCSSMAYHKLEDLIPPRYKLCIQTFVVQKRRQGCSMATRCLWSTKTDNLVSESFDAKTYMATCLVFYVYNE